MARLSVSLLGSLRVLLDGEPVTKLDSDKVRAFLAYLTVESDRSHRREMLAGLLWPKQPERFARHSLSQALFNLRSAIGDHDATPSFLIVTPQTVQFNRSSDHWLDVTAFTTLLTACEKHPHRQLEVCDPCLDRLQQAVALYQGNFLEGFSLNDSAPFEEWCLLQRERLHRLVMDALHRLAGCYEQRGEYEPALQHAWRQVELDPWREEVHQQLMRLLALSGRRSEALAQYETCCRLLTEELGIEPAAETTRLYEQIRNGKLEVAGSSPACPPVLSAHLPSFLAEEGSEVERPVFVARERELAQLGTLLHLALAGQGRVVFVTGGAGRGKTALLEEFARRAQEAHPNLVVASGDCNAYVGIGDPYLPFREVLGLLTGDVEARWAAGAITHERARRLWSILPFTIQALVQDGPGLIDVFVPGTALITRAAACALGGEAWLDWLQELVERKATGPDMANLQQSDLFEQYTQVLRALARQAPLLLILDDLQWADLGSISLLFHLGRRLVDSQVLIVGAYRPEEIAPDRDGKRHPLEPIVNEFQRHFGDILVELGRADDREFAEAFLDSEPNQFGAGFRETFCRQTGGHPLFAVELLRGMQERGDLVQDEAGRWVEGPALDWETLPARVEAAIAERIGRLPEDLQTMLTVASVEGEEFTAEVVARVQATDEEDIVQRLSNELERRHHLVDTQSVQRLGAQRLSRYRFRHYLVQKYLYNRLGEAERAYLHEAVGNVLEALYEERGEDMTVQPWLAPDRLAWHFQEAGVGEKAIHYLRQMVEMWH